MDGCTKSILSNLLLFLLQFGLNYFIKILNN